MRVRLWLVRFGLLIVVSGIVLSPLAVRGATPSSQPVGWNHTPSVLNLPSSATYPAIVAYREFRMSFADKSYEKAELLLKYSNQDAAAIAMMSRRQEYVQAAAHFPTYQHTFDRCVAWLLLAEDRGNNVSHLLSRVKNDHLAQHSALAEAVDLLPEWALEGVVATRSHVATEMLHAVQILEGDDAATSYAQLLVSAYPDLAGIWDTEETQEPIEPDTPTAHRDVPGSVGAESSSATSAAHQAERKTSIIALTPDREHINPGESLVISCVLADGLAEDEHAYSWWCSRGSLVTDGPQATWIAPQQDGLYEISVTATDSEGRSDTLSIEVRVGHSEEALSAADYDANGDESDPTDDDASNPQQVHAVVIPEIISLSATAEHHYIDQNLGGGYAILVSRSADVHCKVVDANGLSFEWTIEGNGELSGSGDTVRMTAPSRPGYVTVTVTVSNEDGEQDTGSLEFYVSTCTYCF